MTILAPVTLPDLESLQQEAARFVQTLAPVADHATLVTLSGELGAGKTSFTQGIASALGITEPITSPTFVLLKAYEIPPPVPGENNSQLRKYTDLVHIDAYRLEGDRSLAPLGFAERYADPRTLIMLEWPELVAGSLPPADIAVSLSVLPEGGRAISYTYA